ncbi:MAG TPA: hypothetical protein VG388_06905 [Solirubrobacteraceae bacterium]|nr:hypothetical protein [Solirubrobacteraceae bacterium]
MTDAPIEPGEREEGIAPVESEELVDGLPILAEVRPLEEPSAPALPAVQAAAAAMTGFVAGAATWP